MVSLESNISIQSGEIKLTPNLGSMPRPYATELGPTGLTAGVLFWNQSSMACCTEPNFQKLALLLRADKLQRLLSAVDPAQDCKDCSQTPKLIQTSSSSNSEEAELWTKRSTYLVGLIIGLFNACITLRHDHGIILPAALIEGLLLAACWLELKHQELSQRVRILFLHQCCNTTMPQPQPLNVITSCNARPRYSTCDTSTCFFLS